MFQPLQKYLTTRAYSEEICDPLLIEDYIPQPVDFVSPPKWHLAHTTWFFEEFILKPYLKGYQLYHERFSYLFNSYYNHVGSRTDRSIRGVITRPSVDEIYAYRHYVDSHIQELLKKDDSDSELNKLLEIGVNHEQQHQELLITDLKYTFSLNPLLPTYKEGFTLVDDIEKDSGMISIEAGNYDIGTSDIDTFSYDNEREQHKVYLNEYKISSALVTNGEFIKFIEDKGYSKFEYWHDEGFSWLVENNISAPLYWQLVDKEWHQYTLGGLKKVVAEQSLAHINFYEASAYANWKGVRLPTEAEWEVASAQFNWGKRWEWTQSAYLPYPGFKIASGALGEYNGKFMVNQKVLRGSSNATSDGHSRKTYRNFFHPHLRWQLTGIRLAE